MSKLASFFPSKKIGIIWGLVVFATIAVYIITEFLKSKDCFPYRVTAPARLISPLSLDGIIFSIITEFLLLIALLIIGSFIELIKKIFRIGSQDFTTWILKFIMISAIFINICFALITLWNYLTFDCGVWFGNSGITF